jgi:hypothetical protein
MGYRDRLRSLDFAESLASTSVRSRVVLLTGQSSFQSSRLLPVQVEFLKAVTPANADALLTGFPYHPIFDRAAPDVSLPAAALRNSMQFAWSVTSRSFRQIIADALRPLMRNTRAIITGSCGLQMLASAAPVLSGATRVVAIGPAMLRPFTLDMQRVYAVQGRRDFWSRLLYRGPVAAYCGADHLGYWESQEVRGIVAELLRSGE